MVGQMKTFLHRLLHTGDKSVQNFYISIWFNASVSLLNGYLNSSRTPPQSFYT